jgi:hypothetical protein
MQSRLGARVRPRGPHLSKWNRTSLAFLAVLCGLSFSPGADACSCISVPLKRAFLASDEVFLGTVVDERGFVAIVRVERRFLGAGTGIQEVTLDSCGRLRKGESFLIFASRHNATIQNNGCLSIAMVSGERGENALRRVARRAALWRMERRLRHWWSTAF